MTTDPDKLTIGAALTLAEAFLAVTHPGDVVTGVHATADMVAVAYGSSPDAPTPTVGPLLVSRWDGEVIQLGSADVPTLPPMRRVDLDDPDGRRARWMDLYLEPVDPPEARKQ